MSKRAVRAIFPRRALPLAAMRSAATARYCGSLLGGPLALSWVPPRSPEEGSLGARPTLRGWFCKPSFLCSASTWARRYATYSARSICGRRGWRHRVSRRACRRCCGGRLTTPSLFVSAASKAAFENAVVGLRLGARGRSLPLTLSRPACRLSIALPRNRSSTWKRALTSKYITASVTSTCCKGETICD